MDDLQSVDINIPSFSDNELVDLLLYGILEFNSSQNNKILSSSISFIIKTERFCTVTLVKAVKSMLIIKHQASILI